MSDFAQGPGWWEASDGRWYAPELHPDHQPPAEPGPPPFNDRTVQAPPPGPSGPTYEPPGRPAEPGWNPGAVPAQPIPPQPTPQGGNRYPAPGGKRRSSGAIIGLIVGGVFLFVIAGCGALAYLGRNEISDALIDFSASEVVFEPALCRVTGVDFADDYEIEVELLAQEAAIASHYEVSFVVVDDVGSVIGADYGVLQSVSPGESRVEDVVTIISADRPVEAVSCEVTEIRRVDA